MKDLKSSLRTSCPIKFCKNCHNLLEVSTNTKNLLYRCTRINCDYQMLIKGKGQLENLVSFTEYQKEKKIIINKNMGSDPTLQRADLICRNCDNDQVVFMIDSDQDDTKIEIHFICTDVECGMSWRKEVEE